MIKKNILVSPLDWGLGHAARCVPIIKELISLGHHVIIGADKNPLAFLKQEFPDLPSITIPGYDVTYDEQGSSLKLFFESIRFYNFIKKEHLILETIVKENDIDIVISDNRYGLWNAKVKSIIITHQVFVKAPVGEAIAHKKIHGLIEMFDDCWIPDVEDDVNLSGDLAHLSTIPFPHHFIGPLTRFKKKKIVATKYDVLAIISGPEPQRTIFEELVIEQLKTSGLQSALISGNPSLIEKSTIEQITIYSHLPTLALQELIEQSNVVLCRSGYSSIMDLITLNQKAILIPTPGQTEQEYLAQYHFDQGNFYTQKQHEFNLKDGLEKVGNYTPKTNLLESLNLEVLLKNP